MYYWSRMASRFKLTNCSNARVSGLRTFWFRYTAEEWRRMCREDKQRDDDRDPNRRVRDVAAMYSHVDKELLSNAIEPIGTQY